MSKNSMPRDPLTPSKVANMLENQGISLSEKQFLMLYHYLQGATKTEACVKAGLRPTSATMLFGSGKVQAAIAAVLERFLIADAAPAALRVLYQILHDTKAAPGVRVQAANSLLDRAGFDAKRLAQAASDGDKLDSEKTADELRAEIAALERELSNRARDVTPDAPESPNDAPNDVPIDPQIIDIFE